MENIEINICSKLHFSIHRPMKAAAESNNMSYFFEWPWSDETPFINHNQKITYFRTIKNDLICQNKKNG